MFTVVERVELTDRPYCGFLVCLETLHECHAMLGGCRLSGLLIENLDIFEVWDRALLVNVFGPGLFALCGLHVG